MGFVKVSLLFYYKRIFVSRFFVIASNALIGLITCFTASIFFVSQRRFSLTDDARTYSTIGSTLFQMACI